VKQQLPPYWTAQLVAIIFLFSIGFSLFPLSYVGQQILNRSIRPEVAFHERFEANLTVANPVVGESLGICSRIYIDEWVVDPTSVLLVHIKDVSRNETVVRFPMSHTFNTSGYASLDIYLPNSNYTIEAHRVANDTCFECVILAYNIYIAPPALLVYYSLWPLGFAMILLGVIVTHRFIRRTKEFYWEVSSV
jgi:hypothetical protein